jgi:peptidyl-prolyl cis-trans isomerase D
MKWFQKRQRTIFLYLAIFITLSVVLGSLGLDFAQRSPLDAAITVENRKITRKRFNLFFEQALEQQRNNPQYQANPEAAREFLKRQVVQSLIQEEVFQGEADRYGVRVTDAELAQYIQSAPQFQREGRFDTELYGRFLSQIRLRAADFEEEQRRQIRVQKTQYLMSSPIRVSSLEWAAREPDLLAAASKEDRKTIRENPAAARDQWRQRETQASFQEWYNVLSTRLKTRVLLETTAPVTAPAATSSPAPAP